MGPLKERICFSRSKVFSFWVSPYKKICKVKNDSAGSLESVSIFLDRAFTNQEVSTSFAKSSFNLVIDCLAPIYRKAKGDIYQSMSEDCLDGDNTRDNLSFLIRY